MDTFFRFFQTYNFGSQTSQHYVNEVMMAYISNVEKTDQNDLSIEHGEKRTRTTQT